MDGWLATLSSSASATMPTTRSGLRKPHSQLALVQGRDAIQPAQRIEDASLKKDGAWTCSVMNKVIDVHSQRFLRERGRIRSRTQPASAPILNHGTGGVADDLVTTSLP